MVEPTFQEGFPTSKLKELYHSFEKIYSGSYYFIYKAALKSDGAIHHLRVLDLNSELVEQDYNHAATLFLQEAFYLANVSSERKLFIIESIEYFDKMIVIATMPTEQLAQCRNPDIQLMMEEVQSNLNFLALKMNLTKLVINTQTIHCLHDEGEYFLIDWMKTSDRPETTNTTYELALVALETATSITSQEIEQLRNASDANYHKQLDAVLKRVPKHIDQKPLKNLLKRVPQIDKAPQIEMAQEEVELAAAKELEGKRTAVKSELCVLSRRFYNFVRARQDDVKSRLLQSRKNSNKYLSLDL